jgi:hypothetical protein
MALLLDEAVEQAVREKKVPGAVVVIGPHRPS